MPESGGQAVDNLNETNQLVEGWKKTSIIRCVVFSAEQSKCFISVKLENDEVGYCENYCLVKLFN